jgi:hypothetical protein
MKIAFLGYSLEKKWEEMSPIELGGMFEQCFAFDKKLRRDGYFLDAGTALQPSRTAKTLRWQKGAVVVTDGPYAETKEQLGGAGVVEARDMDEAVELVSKHPALNYGAAFELRPIDEESLSRQAASIKALRAVPAPDPHSVRFASLGYTSGWGSISEDQRTAMFKSCIAYDEARVKNGQWQSGIGLRDAQSAKTLRKNAGQLIVTDGPFAETKEQLGGIVVLAFKDLSEGLALLSKHPALPFGLTIEIRPLDEEIARRWESETSDQGSARAAGGPVTADARLR